MAKILIVDDEPPIRQLLHLTLTRQQYDVVMVENGVQALKVLAGDSSIDLVLLDWMLPDTSGIKLLAEIRQTKQLEALPVIMLTAKAEEGDVLRGFGMGVDDYVTKPFSPKELIMRIQALLKRTKVSNNDQSKLTFRELNADLQSHLLSCKGKVVKCGRLEFKLITYLMQHAGKTLSRARILDHVWDADKEITERTVDVHITRVRKLLAPFHYDIYLRAIRGEGYQLINQDLV
ncbi:response regulator [Cysteiniphilum halobium]|uniref:response regulator n=1 Tax=Cysteiniphilum halobium TaxID=2219059 RepID=UPI000E650E19|nr:response regulator [Cysteiniphilum halobium]